MELIKNNIYNLDCVIGMQKMEDNTVDFVLADPPYVIARDSGFHRMGRNGLDFGDWDKEFDNKYYLTEVSRVLKPGGSLVAFNSFTKATEVYKIATTLGLDYKDTLIWRKTNPIPRNRERRYVPDVEMIQWYVKPKGRWTFNRQEGHYESSVISFPSESGSLNKDRFHPTQKPLKLIEYLIEIHSNSGDLILDPFMGSSTTAIAAIKLQRDYIGFEKEENYYTKSLERIKRQNKRPQKLF